MGLVEVRDRDLHTADHVQAEVGRVTGLGAEERDGRRLAAAGAVRRSGVVAIGRAAARDGRHAGRGRQGEKRSSGFVERNNGSSV